ncbi:EamA family transporter [Ancylomarina sp. YFZ004]
MECGNTVYYKIISFTQFACVGLMSLLISGSYGEIQLPVGKEAWKALLFIAIFATSYMYTIQNYYQKYILELTTAIIFAFEPIFASLTAIIYFNESFWL